jgi:hypothetical protein
MRSSLLFSVALLGLAGCVNVHKDPPPTTISEGLTHRPSVGRSAVGTRPW